MNPAEFASVEGRLQAALKTSFGEVVVRVGQDIHYRGTNVVVTSPEFSGLLPEQRFHHVVRALPAELYDTLRGSVVWFELAPAEPPTDYMRMPRSEDIAGQETDILKRLAAVKFFKKFEDRLLAERTAPSQRDFVVAKEVLGEAGLSAEEITRACLFFIRHGGFSDAQVFSHVMEELAGAHTDENGKAGATSKSKRRANTNK
jgi:hypothetical protein